ncbi:MAG: response regulator [Clostridiales bacterium]|nr:response regulator [Clostridiales bacterium]
MIRVLMVDDEPLVRHGVAAGMDWASLGCEVVGEAQSGEEGLALARRLKPDLIITDIRMPKMDGITMMNMLREEGCAARCIVLTAHSDFEYARGALLFGADDYLLKPFRNQELTHAVARTCRKMESAPAANTPAVKKEPEATGYVRQAMDYIAGHYADENISIATIAEHLCVSEGHLSHVFKKQTGMTVTNYLTKTRIDAAMALLQTGRVKVYEAAAAVGYKDVTYFSATFKKLTGLSPSEVE